MNNVSGVTNTCNVNLRCISIAKKRKKQTEQINKNLKSNIVLLEFQFSFASLSRKCVSFASLSVLTIWIKTWKRRMLCILEFIKDNFLASKAKTVDFCLFDPSKMK